MQSKAQPPDNPRPISAPISSEPATLTVNVENGKPDDTAQGSISREMRYLSALPAKPPAPTSKRAFIFVCNIIQR